MSRSGSDTCSSAGEVTMQVRPTCLTALLLDDRALRSLDDVLLASSRGEETGHAYAQRSVYRRTAGRAARSIAEVARDDLSAVQQVLGAVRSFVQRELRDGAPVIAADTVCAPRGSFILP
jgi:hypothetical protein